MDTVISRLVDTAVLDTLQIWTAAESLAKVIGFCLKEMSLITDSRSLLQT